MSGGLQAWIDLGVLTRLDQQLAQVLADLVGGAAAEVQLGAAFASRAVRRGQVCADLRRLGASALVDDRGAPVEVPHEAPSLPETDAWLAALGNSPLVAAKADEADPRPLVLDAGGRLYLYRYAHYQQRVASVLLAQASTTPPHDAAVLAEGLLRLFGDEGGANAIDRQVFAALVAVTHGLCVICGGPGTGKTFTVTKILALLQEQARAAGQPPLRVRLLAPTGKAAARLGESVAAGVSRLPCDESVRQSVACPASTIHRALGYQPRRPTEFRHGRAHPLAADVVVADEVSMVDVALMAKLLDAVRPGARLILLGDADQLASVEAGAILGDIFAEGPYSESLDEQARQLCRHPVPQPADLRTTSPKATPAPLADCMVRLVDNHRYRPGSGIAALATAVNAGDADGAMEAIGAHADLELHAIDDRREIGRVLGALAVDRFATLATGTAADRLRALGRFRILCAHRRDHLGVEQVSEQVARQLEHAGLLQLDGPFYDGRPILITSNDYRLGLFNGDVGVIAQAQSGEGRRAFFAAPGGELRAIPPGRLPPHETMFATTVHKSQGSETDEVALLMPAWRSPILTRELLYTAITRARKRVHLFASEEVLRAAIARRIERPSGLREALSAEAPTS